MNISSKSPTTSNSSRCITFLSHLHSKSQHSISPTTTPKIPSSHLKNCYRPPYRKNPAISIKIAPKFQKMQHPKN
nr:MAG TPA: hypothetical protein [Caudoviricetes sp.]